MEKTRHNFNRSGSGDIEGIIVLVVLGLIIAGILLIFGFNFGIENEGTVKYDDCRQVITLKNDGWKKYFHKFTCTISKTKSGETMGGECVSIETDGSLFSSSGACEKAYVYEKEPYKKCPEGEYLTQDGDCKCSTGIKRNTTCISYDEACKLSYGNNVQGVRDWENEDDAKCSCISGYMWNERKTGCVSIYAE